MNNICYDFLDKICFSDTDRDILDHLGKKLKKIYNRNFIKKQINRFRLDLEESKNIHLALVQESEISKDIYHDVLKFQDFLARIRLSIDFEIPSLKKERLRFFYLINTKSLPGGFPMNLQKLIYKAEFEAIVLNVYEELLAWVRANPSYREEIPCEACIGPIIKSAHGHIIELVGDTEKIIADIYREFCRDLGGSYKWLGPLNYECK